MRNCQKIKDSVIESVNSIEKSDLSAFIQIKDMQKYQEFFLTYFLILQKSNKNTVHRWKNIENIKGL